MPLAIHAEYPSTLKLIDDDTATLLGWEPSRGLLQWQDLPVEALNHLRCACRAVLHVDVAVEMKRLAASAWPRCCGAARSNVARC
eukprot:scaffold291253_cov31-Tisochrysis_lutea.AAC.4